MKFLIMVAIFFTLTGCSSTKIVINHDELKDEINASIIDGFYNNDTSGISKSIYLLK